MGTEEDWRRPSKDPLRFPLGLPLGLPYGRDKTTLSLSLRLIGAWVVQSGGGDGP